MKRALWRRVAPKGLAPMRWWWPVVAPSLSTARPVRWAEVPVYVGGQMVGAVAAALTLLGLLGPVAQLGVTLPAGSVWQSFDLEVVLTAFLMFVITAVATDTRAVGQLAALAIGGTVALDALFGGPISGASMNPARSLGPALAAGIWAHQVGLAAGPADRHRPGRIPVTTYS